MKLIIRLKGGAGSGNFDHKGRPGSVGGSASAEGVSLKLDYSDDPSNFVGRFPEAAAEFEATTNTIELGQLKRRYTGMSDNGTTNVSDGAIHYFWKKNRERLQYYQPRSVADARADMILHITDSSGKRRARKF